MDHQHPENVEKRGLTQYTSFGSIVGGVAVGDKIIDSQISTNVNIGSDQYSIRDKCLQSLSFAGMLSRCSDQSRVDGTCEWIKENETFISWLEGGGALWLCGKGGSGKSMLMDYLVEEVGLKFPRFLWFAFNRGMGELKRSAVGMLRAFSHGLLSNSEDLSRDFLEAFDFERKCRAQGRSGEKWEWSKVELERWLRRAFENICYVTPMRLFLDGMDEIDGEDCMTVLRFMRKLSKSTGGKVSVCFSSRHLDLPKGLFDANIQVDKANKVDTAILMSDRLSDLEGVSDDNLLKAIQENLSKKTEGVLLWLNWALRPAEKLIRSQETVQYVLSALNEVPRELSKVYEQDLGRIEDWDVEFAMRVFQWTCLTSDPVSVTGMRTAICLGEDFLYSPAKGLITSRNRCPDDQSFEKRVDRACLGLIRRNDVGQSIFRLDSNDRLVSFLYYPFLACTHDTIRDFMVRDGINILQRRAQGDGTSSSTAAMHIALARQCFRLLTCSEAEEWVDRWIKGYEQGLRRKLSVEVKIENESPMFSTFAFTANKVWTEQLQMALKQGANAHEVLKFMIRVSRDEWRQVSMLTEITK